MKIDFILNIIKINYMQILKYFFINYNWYIWCICPWICEAFRIWSYFDHYLCDISVNWLHIYDCIDSYSMCKLSLRYHIILITILNNSLCRSNKIKCLIRFAFVSCDCMNCYKRKAKLSQLCDKLRIRLCQCQHSHSQSHTFATSTCNAPNYAKPKKNSLNK